MQNHRVHGVSIMPGVVFLDLVLRILKAKGLDPAAYRLERICFLEPVATSAEVDKTLLVDITLPGETLGHVAISSRAASDGGAFRPNMRAALAIDDDPPPPAIDASRFGDAGNGRFEMAELYRRARAERIEHGPAMRCTGSLTTRSGALLADLALEVDDDGFLMHPAALDATTIAAFGQTAEAFDDPFIPLTIDRFRFRQALPGRFMMLAPARERLADTADIISNDYALYDRAGAFCASFDRLVCKRIRAPELIERLLEPDLAAPSGPVATDGGCTTYFDLIRDWVASLTGLDAAAIEPATGFYDLGLNSTDLLGIAERLEAELGLAVYPTLLFEYSTVAALAGHLRETYGEEVLAGRVPLSVAAGRETCDDLLAPVVTELAQAGWTPDLPSPSPARPRAWSILGADESVAARLREALGPERPLTEFPGGDACVLMMPAEDAPGRLLLWAADHVRRIVRAGNGPVDVLFVAHGELTVAVEGLTGYCRSVRAETPRLRARVLLAARDDLADALRHELAVDRSGLAATAGAILWTSQGVRIRGLVPMASAPEPESPAIPGFVPGDLCVVSGGGGGIARHLCAWLGQVAPALDVLLLGRSSEPPAWLAEADARGDGRTIGYARCDVADARMLDDVLGRRRAGGARIRAVVHAAGAAPAALHLDLDQAEIDRVLTPKLAGFAALDAATRADPLLWFLTFSSLAAWRPNVGQAAYASANAALEALVNARADNPQRAGRTLAIAWPLWAEGGMQLSRAEQAGASRQTGLVPLPTAAAFAALGLALAGGSSRVAVLHGDPQLFRTLLGPVAERAAPAASPQRPLPGDDSDAVAIIGLAGRFPDAADIEAFWQCLCRGHDAVRPVPAARWAELGSQLPEGAIPGHGGLLDDIDVFDARMFNISRKEAERLDPQERLFLETCWTLFENAGHPARELKGEDVGVFAGVMWNHYQLFGSDAEPAPPAMHASIANRVSYAFDLRGPSMAVDTACSSSLTAIGLALDAIRLGRCRMAIAGGVNLAVHPEKYRQLASGQFLSGDGKCRSFGVDGTGYVPGEGVGAVLLRPLRDALRDGDDIWGVVSGFAARHGGQTAGFTVPSPSSQARVIGEAWRGGGIRPDTLCYLEAHGTGTALGDPIEIEGLVEALGEARSVPLPIGAVKSNIGHLESAAGIASLGKVLLMLRARTLVPSLHSAELNPRLPLEGTGLEVVQQLRPWSGERNGGRLRAGISSFGAGGVNVHLVIDEYSLPARPAVTPAPRLIVLSAPDSEGLADYAKRLRSAVPSDAGPTEMEDLSVAIAQRLGISPADIQPSDTLVDLGVGALDLAKLRDLVGEDIDPERPISSLRARPVDEGRDEASLLAAIAYQLQCRRTHLPVRAAFFASSLAELRATLARLEEGRELEGPGPNIDPAGQAMIEAWLGGANQDFAGLWSEAAPRRISLPVPRLSRRDRFWAGRWKSASASSQSLGPVAARPAPAAPLKVSSSREGSAMTAPGETEDVVLFEMIDDGVALVTLNDPVNHNMFTADLLAAVEHVFAQIAADETVRAVVITGTPRVFSLGGTPETLEAIARKDMSFTAAPFLYEGLRRCPVPIVAAVRGRAAGGGLAFALHADLVVMDRAGLYAANFVNFGFTPGLGATYVLDRCFGSLLAHEMMLTGKDYRGAELEARGARIFADTADVLELAVRTARSIARHPAKVVRALKRDRALRAEDGLVAAIERELAMHEDVLGADTADRLRGRVKPRPEEPAAPAPPPPAARAENPAPVPEIAAASVDAVTEVVVESLRATLYLEREEIDFSSTFNEMGLDSLGAVEIVHAINDHFSTSFESVLIYDHPTIMALAEKVASALVRQLPPAPGALAPVARAERTTEGAELEARPTAASPRPPASDRPATAPVAPIVLRGAGERSGATMATAPQTAPGKSPPAVVPALRLEAASRATAPTSRLVRSDIYDGADIAIVGMSARYPGSNSVETFWENLRDGRNSVGRDAAGRWRNPAFCDDPGLAEGPHWVGFVDDVDRFDAAFFGISPREAELMDPQQRVFLEQAWRALEHSGNAIGPDRVLDCGVFVGTASGDYLSLLRARGVADSGQVFIGSSGSILAGRIAYFLNLRGPTVALDTACSSSLVAVHLAIQAIRAGDCRMAMAGGIGLMITPQMFVWNSNSGMLSKNGRCAAFDSTADGFVLGEGVGLVVLKSLADAIEDRDAIYAVIKASGINGDGRTNGITAPSADAQFDLQTRVHARSKVAAEEIGYIETHGAGTQLGDPIEMKALSRLMAGRGTDAGPCAVGSVKTNVGHTTLAAGVAGLIKVTMGLVHRTIPASLHFDHLNENIRIDADRLRIASRAEPWRPGPSGVRHAALNSLGVSGTNCHVVVAEAPELRQRDAAITDEAWLLPVSAKTPAALTATLRLLREDLGRDIPIPDMAFTLATGRAAFPCRAAVVGRDREELLAEVDRLLVTDEQPCRADPAFADPGAWPDWSKPLDLDALRAMAERFRAGQTPDFEDFCRDRAGMRVPLSGYPLEPRRFWLPEDEVSPREAAMSPEPDRKLLEVLTPDGGWVREHKVRGRAWLPGAAVLHWSFERLTPSPSRLTEIRWLHPAEVGGREEVYCTRDRGETHALRFGLATGGDWATVRSVTDADAAPARIDPAAVDLGLPHEIAKDELYRRFANEGIAYGPGFRLIRSLRHDASTAVAWLDPAREAGPQLYDAILQSCAALAPRSGTYVPSRIAEAIRHGPVERTMLVLAVATAPECFDVFAYDRSGEATLTVRGFELAPLTASRTQGYIASWAPVEPPAGSLPGATRGFRIPWECVGFDGLAEAPGADRLAGIRHLMLDVRAAPDDDADMVLSRLRERLPRMLDGIAPEAAVTLITSGGAATDDEERLRPTQAAVTALARAAVGETRGLRFRAIDLPAGSADALDALPLDDAPEGLSAWRRGRLLRPVLSPVALDAAAALPVERDKVYLIVGGAGGLGFALSRELAHAGARIAWIGRRQQDAAIAGRMAEIAALGARIVYESADVADYPQLRAAIGRIRQQLGPISGAFHSALDLRDGLLSTMSDDDFRAALRPKIAGCHALQKALEGEPIRHFVLFSSVAAIMCAPGQANYASASAYLDLFAADVRRRLKLPVQVVDWGFWGSVGAVSNSRHAQAMALRGVDSIEPADGFAWLRHQLDAGLPSLVVIRADPGRLGAFGLVVADNAGAVSGSADADPALDGGPQPAPKSPVVQASPMQPAGEHVLDYVAGVFSRQLKLERDSLDVDATFDAWGVDSLMAMDIVRQLKRDLGELRSTLLYERLTIGEVARHLEKVKPAELAALLNPAPAARAADAQPQPAPPADPVRAPVPVEPVMSPAPALPETRPVAGRAGSQVQAPRSADIAVIGMAGRFPGAADLDTFWSNLRAGRRSIGEPPAARGDWKRLLSRRPARNRAYNIEGGFLDGIDRFDAAFFNILPSDAAGIDPQERLFLETCWELLERAGHDAGESREAFTGVFVGAMYGSYGQLAAAAGWGTDRFDLGHSAMWSIANRVSYQFDLNGPSMCVDTACSSSMTAVHLACEALRRGECRQAIAGGVNLILHPAHHVALSAMNMLGTGAACRTFDAQANGIVPGEGVGAVLLRPLADAEADGDDIWAVICGSEVNAGGKTGGYTVPNPNAQADVIRRALARAGVAAKDVGCIEVHGTGTALGDPIEIAALNQVFGGEGGALWVSSVKANIGHLEGAAGIAGLIKAILQLRGEAVAPCAGLEALNDKIVFDGRVRPALTGVPWKSGDAGQGERFCGVSSFGAGGANAHIVLREAPREAGTGSLPSGEQLFLLSATGEDQLKSYAGDLADWLTGTPGVPLARLAYTSQTGRRALPVRAAIRADSCASLAEELRKLAAGTPSVLCVRSEDQSGVALPSGELGRALVASLHERARLPELAQAWACGAEIDWAKLWPLPPQRCAYPALRLNSVRYWFRTPDASKTDPESGTAPPGPREADSGGESRFSRLADQHRLNGRAILPGAALAEMAIAHARAENAAAVADLRWHCPIEAGDTASLEIAVLDVTRRAIVGPPSGSSIVSFALAAELPCAAPVLTIPPEAATDCHHDGDSFYASLAAGGFVYGPELRLLRALRVGPDYCVATLAAGSASGAVAPLLDAAMQTVALLCNRPMIPAGFAACRWFGDLRDARRALALATGPRLFDLALVDDAGAVLLHVAGFRVVPFDGPADPARRQPDYLVPTLVPAQAPEPVSPRRLVVAHDGGAIAEAIGHAAAQAGIPTVDLDDAEAGEIDAGLFCLTGRTAQEEPAIGLAAALRRLFDLVDLLRQRRGESRVRAVVAVASGDEVGRALAGATRSLAMENPWLTLVHVTVDDWSRVADLVRECATATPEMPELVLTTAGRAVRSLVALAALAAPSPALNPGALYLVTGGAGGLGRIFAVHLAGLGAGTVALAGRRPASEALTAWMASAAPPGCRFVYRCVDVADQGALREAVDGLVAEFGPLRGVVHAAGITRDSLSRSKTDEQIAQVLAAKVTGTLALDRCTEGQELDFFMICGSLASEAGSIGQADYAAANRFAQNFAEARERRRAAGSCSGKSVTVAWPLWREGGMSVDEATARMFAERFGMHPLETEAGLVAFDQALTGAAPSFAVMAHVPEARAGADPLGRAPKGGPDVSAGAGSGADVAAADEQALVAHALKQITTLAADYLLVAREDVEIDRPLLDIGFDSVSLTNLVNQINAQLDLDLLTSVLFECATFSDFAAWLVREHRAAVGVDMLRARPAPKLDAVPSPPSPPPAPAAVAVPDPAVAPASVARAGGDDRAADPIASVDEPIAVIGMAGRFAGARSVRDLWDKLTRHEELLRPVDENRPELLADPDTAGISAGFLDAVDLFDAAAFGISPREAALMDPQQRLFLEAVHDAVEDAGYSRRRLAGREVGVFAGVSTSDYSALMTEAGVPDEPHAATGISHAVLANRVSNVFDWTGPSEIVDTACSSSLVALAHAVRSLRAGDCDMACAGGANVILAPGLFHAFQKSGMLSPDHRCKTFDADADGYVRGEGVGVVVLKRLSDAVRSGDRIRAVIRAVAVNHVGRSTSLTAPNPAAQAQVIRTAIEAARIDPDTIGFIETHGTGTRLGDVVEAAGLKAAFSGDGPDAAGIGPIYLGALKTATGHLEAAAGIAGVIRTVLSLENNHLVANRNFTRLNPGVRLDESPFALLDRNRRWTESDRDRRRAGVSSFGFGGTNAHAVLESFAPPESYPDQDGPGPVAVPVAAPGALLLRQHAAELADAIAADGLALADVAFTLRECRDPNAARAVLIARTAADLVRRLRAIAAPDTGEVSIEDTGIPAEEAAAARAWLAGGDPAWPPLRGRRCALPPTPLDRRSFWFGPRAAAASAHRRDRKSEGAGPLRVAGRVVLDSVDEAAAPVARLTRPKPPSAGIPAAVPVPPPSPAQSPAAIDARLVRYLAELMLIEPAAIGSDDSFTELGLDSILRMNLATLLNADFGLSLSGADLYESDNVRALAARIALLVGTEEAAVEPASREEVAAMSSASSATGEPGAVAPSAIAATERLEPAVTAFIAAISGHAVAADQEFSAAGLTSFLMLKAIATLERALGPLPKTLLFDHPTPERLAVWLAATHPDAAECALDPTPPVSECEGDALPDFLELPDGAIVASKACLDRYPEVAALVETIDRAHAKEQGLPGRDIAPYIFIGADRAGYLHFAGRDRLLITWNSCVSEQGFQGLAEQWVAWAVTAGLSPNLLSMVPLARLNDVPFRSTAFGTVQRIGDLSAFSLRGKRMARLRDKINAFARAEDIRIREYQVGSEPAIDARIVQLIDEWAGRKDMVNPYVKRVRAEIGAGQLAPRHRTFLTEVAGVVQVAIIVTRIASENGYLLDLEFYADAMPPGGVDYTTVQVLERLRAEGVAMFSFGATLGVKIVESPNPHPAVEQALADLRSSGLFRGDGNLQFKNKYRPDNLPIYLCQPADASAADVSALLLLITSPAIGVGESLAENGPPVPGVPQLGPPAAPGPQRTRPAVGAAGSGAGAGERCDELRRRNWNAMELPAPAPWLDLVTDSWAAREDGFIAERAATIAAAEVPAGGDADPFGFRYALPMPSGRAAESLLLQLLKKPGRATIVQTRLFSSWAYHCLDLGYTPRIIESDPQTGAPDFDALTEVLAAHGSATALCCIELAPNALGGSPIGLAALRRASEIAAEHGVPLVFDATRGLGNALAIARGAGRSLITVAREIAALGSAMTLSLSKEYGLGFGGLIGTNDPELGRMLELRVRDRGHEVSLSARRGITAALADGDWIEAKLAERSERVAMLAERLSAGGVPLSAAGVHAVLIDASAMFPGSGDAVASTLAWLYHRAGIKGAPHLHAGIADLRNSVRLAIPIGMEASDFDRLLAAVDAALAPGPSIGELIKVAGGSDGQAHYVPRAGVPDDIAEDLAVAKPGAPEGNWRIMQRWQSAVERRLLNIGGKAVEIFEAGRGEPLILVHPFNVGAGFFAPQLKELAESHRVVVIHAPGAGGSAAIDDLSFAGLSAHLIACASTLRLPDQVTWAGASFGGLTALSVALRHPERVRRLILLGSSYKVGNRKGEINRLSTVVEQDFDSLEAAGRSGDLGRAEVSRMLADCETMDPKTGLRYLDVFATRPNLLADARQLAVPTLLIHGACDTVIDPGIARTLADAIPGSRLVMLDEAGHFPSLTCYRAVNALIRDRDSRSTVSDRTGVHV